MSKTSARDDSVERLPEQRSTIITDELNKILVMLREVTPPEATISFDFDGELNVHVDVRSYEDMLKIEDLLPRLGGGTFCCTERSSTPNRPFFHRVTARVFR